MVYEPNPTQVTVPKYHQSDNRCHQLKLDFLSLGSLVHRLDPGIVPFRKARSVDIHVSGGEYNVAAGLSDCFGLNTGIASAMVDYGIGELVETSC